MCCPPLTSHAPCHTTQQLAGSPKHPMCSAAQSNTHRNTAARYGNSPSTGGMAKPHNLHNGMSGSAALPRHLLLCKVHFSVPHGTKKSPLHFAHHQITYNIVQIHETAQHHYNRNRPTSTQGCIQLKISTKQRQYKNTPKNQHDILQHKGTTAAVKINAPPTHISMQIGSACPGLYNNQTIEELWWKPAETA